eukprot:3275187-Pyramimonas_sp.AAC.1
MREASGMNSTCVAQTWRRRSSGVFFSFRRQSAPRPSRLVPWTAATSHLFRAPMKGRRRTAIIFHRSFEGDVDATFKQRGEAISVGLRWGPQSILFACAHLPPHQNVGELPSGIVNDLVAPNFLDFVKTRVITLFHTMDSAPQDCWTCHYVDRLGSPAQQIDYIGVSRDLLDRQIKFELSLPASAATESDHSPICVTLQDCEVQAPLRPFLAGAEDTGCWYPNKICDE